MYNFLKHEKRWELNRKSWLRKLNKPILNFPPAVRDASDLIHPWNLLSSAQERKHSWLGGRFPGASANMRGVCVYVPPRVIWLQALRRANNIQSARQRWNHSPHIVVVSLSPSHRRSPPSPSPPANEYVYHTTAEETANCGPRRALQTMKTLPSPNDKTYGNFSRARA